MLYPFNKVNKIITQRNLWGIQKNIEVEEKWAQKKEEQEKRIRKNNLIINKLNVDKFKSISINLFHFTNFNSNYFIHCISTV